MGSTQLAIRAVYSNIHIDNILLNPINHVKAPLPEKISDRGTVIYNTTLEVCHAETMEYQSHASHRNTIMTQAYLDLESTPSL